MPADAIDVLVRGAGPVGCVAALALRSHKKVRLLGAERKASGFRPIVLSYASRLILERLAVWDSLQVTPIETIRVSQAGRFGRVVFGAGDSGVPALGYVLEYAELVGVLRRAARDVMTETELPARCDVHAEGAAADAREKRYAQDAIVASVRLDPGAATTAFERFTSEGPLALLPLGERYALVWSMSRSRAARLAAASEAEFLSELAAALGAGAGRALEARLRTIQPLVLRVKRRSIGERCVYIGNAAQTLHPVAGQGLNVGLRDAWELAQAMREAGDAGDASVLARFAARRRLDARAAIAVTDLLARFLLRPNPLSGALLTALDVLPAPRRFFARRMIFGPSALP